MNYRKVIIHTNTVLNNISGIKELWISGGIDSMCLLFSVKNRKDIKVIHFHHGDTLNASYRNDVSDLVESFCLSHNIPFVLIKNEDQNLSSELDFRNFRNQYLSKNTITAHHADDIFETQMIRLIRGNTLDLKFNKIMPFSVFTKKQINEFANFYQVPFLEDPTNKVNDNLRNYLRNEVIPKLNEFHQNFQSNMAKSLLKINGNDND